MFDAKIEDNALFKIIINEFKEKLTKKQLEIFENCIILEFSNREYARIKGVSETAIRKTIRQIEEKAKKYFLKGSH